MHNDTRSTECYVIVMHNDTRSTECYVVMIHNDTRSTECYVIMIHNDTRSTKFQIFRLGSFMKYIFSHTSSSNMFPLAQLQPSSG
jgi:hypothetical protein